MRVSIKRDYKFVEYEIEDGDFTILEALEQIKHTKDATLSYQKGCKSEICGCCTVQVDGKPKLACGTIIKDKMVIEPLKYHRVKRDLIVDKKFSVALFRQTKAYLDVVDTDKKATKKDEKRIELQSDCILCNSCYSVCPVLEVNPNFIGPFALTKVLRYSDDVKEKDKKSKIDAVQTNAIWDCTICGECSIACPQGISSKDDILQLRIRSAAFGYSDPNMGSFDAYCLDWS